MLEYLDYLRWPMIAVAIGGIACAIGCGIAEVREYLRVRKFEKRLREADSDSVIIPDHESWW